jgi:mRNA-degrading endonuclease RelE of RelBE toxin-antitoxin system
MSELPFIQVEATRIFQRNLNKLSKKYSHIRQDIQPIIEKLQQGEILGDQIPRTGYNVFKLRVRNSDNQKGKSGGYRLIYYLKTKTAIILLTIYSKSEQSDINTDNIQTIIAEYESE